MRGKVEGAISGSQKMDLHKIQGTRDLQKAQEACSMVVLGKRSRNRPSFVSNAGDIFGDYLA